jgi:fructose-specific phosphotransferase system component IIB
VAGIDRTGAPVIASYGTVTAFGSVAVNGVHYDTSQARFVIDGDTGTQADLRIGDVVLVNGTLDSGGTTGVATTVWFDHNVEGPVTSIDLVGKTVVVLGQLVRVSADTSFDAGIQPAALSGLAVGDVVEVSGLVQGDDSINATRIERRPGGGGEYEVTGVVVGTQVGLHTFFLGAISVNYSVAVVSGVAGGVVANGQHVRVKGTFGAQGVLVASRVDYLSNALGGESGERREVEGLITRFASATDFSLGLLTVTTTAQTSYEGGTAADLGLNVKVEVEGTLGASGKLAATKIEVRRSAPVRMVASVDSVNVAANSFVALGVTVQLDALTRLEDQSSQQVRPFSLANLAAGDTVEVRGSESPAGSGQLLATLVERRSSQQDTELQGFVQSVTPPLFVVLGVQITTNNGTQFEGVGGVAQLAVGSLVKVTGQKLGDRAMTAHDVEVDD